MQIKVGLGGGVSRTVDEDSAISAKKFWGFFVS